MIFVTVPEKPNHDYDRFSLYSRKLSSISAMYVEPLSSLTAVLSEKSPVQTNNSDQTLNTTANE